MTLASRILAALALLTLAACQTSPSLAEVEPVVGADRVEMHDNAFEPPVIQIPAGTTVTWAFTDGSIQHNVVAEDFESEVKSDGTFTHTFTDPGTHDYRCTLHPGMTGRVIVT
jgi:plastocyanin